MELEDLGNGGKRAPGSAGNVEEPLGAVHPADFDSACSTPYVSAPSSPARGAGCFFSAPASPVHFVLCTSPCTSAAAAASAPTAAPDVSVMGSFEFEFSARCSGKGGGAAAASAMTSADELFLNGQIRPMRLASHLQRPQILAPLLDLEEEDEGAAIRGRDPRGRSRSLCRRARSLSPLRNAPFQWGDVEEEEEESRNWPGVLPGEGKDGDPEIDPDLKQVEAAAPSMSASSSRSSSASSGRSSRRWVFLRDLLYRSKSEGRESTKDKFWHAIALSPSKDRSPSLFFRDRSKDSAKRPPASVAYPVLPSSSLSEPPGQKNAQLPPASPVDGTKMASSASSKPASRGRGRRVPTPSAHERLYTANRAQAEEMRKKTFLPYRQGLLGCLGFSSRSYGAMNGLARTLNPVSSR